MATNKKKKMRFEVNDGETISECLDRIASEGYTPVRRMEEPLFEEVKQGGQVEYKPVRQKTIFEAVLNENASL
ncbi:NETI motif-containing protein [Bacillus alkalicellulosilyticus]|uniref:NETI motif-containing protein n=1 Tax=Alkalihalobacterium alkalicellulosilyticum TaxID=1912214 RepID=UPI001FEBE805|nr:NETI motif-containing protein [Bacillus alkalicellulosilyticus]